MIEKEFTAMVQRIKEYFDKPQYATWERHGMWFPKVKHIPAEAIPYIENCIYDNWSIPPANLPRHMRDYYQAWKSANAEKFVSYPRSPCPECGGKGLLWVSRPAMIDGQIIQRQDSPLYETVSYRCAHCENWRRHCHADSKPAATKMELTERGFELI